MACSKLSGWSETGFAFGMCLPPMASGAAYSSPRISSEHASAVACSASCYDTGKDVRILPVVMPVRELRQIQRQVGFADLMEGAHHAALEQAPERFDVVRVDVPAHIFFFHMVHSLMRMEWEQFIHASITARLISRDQRCVDSSRRLAIEEMVDKIIFLQKISKHGAHPEILRANGRREFHHGDRDAKRERQRVHEFGAGEEFHEPSQRHADGRKRDVRCRIEGKDDHDGDRQQQERNDSTVERQIGGVSRIEAPAHAICLSPVNRPRIVL